MIIEDELFDKLIEAIPIVTKLMNMIGKIDVTLSFVQYLRSFPSGIDISRPILTD